MGLETYLLYLLISHVLFIHSFTLCFWVCVCAYRSLGISHIHTTYFTDRHPLLLPQLFPDPPYLPTPSGPYLFSFPSNY